MINEIETETKKELNFYEITQYQLTNRYPILPDTLGLYISSEQIFTDEECNNIIKIGYSKIFNYQQTTDKIVNKDAFNYKTSIILPETDDIDFVYKRLRSLVMSINISIWNYNIYDFGEPMKFTEYNELDKSSTCVHSDLAQGLTTYRKLTVIAQLSDENSYEGGDVYVQEGSELIQTTKKKGSVIVFPSFLMHCVKPVTKGIRNSIVLFVYGPPFC